ncbi:MAG TPA: sigma-70 family RNA polymerase sigma factor [Anaerolineae bacterium]|nr:sigma-70 family RNA polymerase sigma factor [Anaerolineae bacterium]
MTGLPNGMDEPTLIAAAQRGNVDTFNELVLAYQQQVYNLAYRIMGDPASAADAAQEAFISAFQNIGRFRGGSFKSYLLRIVSNGCYDELRRRKRRPATSFEDFGEVDEDANPALVNGAERPEEYAERQEMARVIQAGIETLPPDQRITLALSDVQGLSYQEIAEVTSVSLGTVKSRLARARGKLRDYLRARGELLPARYRL